MGTSSATICPKCGSALSGGASGGLCLRCLGRFGLAPEAGEPVALRLGDYELLEEIARGGMGVVYRARQLSLNRVVAVKVVLHGPFSSPDFVRRFRNEAQAAATLRHPNIVSVYEVGEYGGHHFLSMEYVDGPNLAELVRDQPLAARRAAGYVKAIAEAVEHAHQRGVLHRDLKPSNVLLDAFDQPRVTDFGLAKMLDGDAELTITGQILGSPSHMPPEQAAGSLSQTTTRSDIYSLGSILYHLVAGRPPFQGGSLPEILAQVQNSEPIPPRKLNPGVPEDLQSICLKCLRKEPARRYATARELAEDLDRFLSQKPVQARPIRTVERAWLWCRRSPVLAVLTLSLAVAVLAGLGGIVWQWRRAESHARGERIQRLAAEENSARTRLNLYAADVNLAAQALKDGDYGLARHTLEGLRPQAGEPDLRGFEWRYLWDLSRGNQLATFTGHQWIVTCAAFSPDGKQAVTGSMDGEARIWDLARRDCVRVLKADAHALWAVGFTPDGKTLMIGGTGGVQFWNIDPWRKLTQLPGRLAALSPDGTTVAVSESSPFYFEEAGPVTLWNWRAGEKLRTFSQPGRALALSPDARTLAMAGSSADITLWDTSSGAKLRSLPVERPVWSLRFSPAGRRLVCAGWCGQAQVWDLSADSPPRVISANHLNLWTATFSPDGATIITTGSDQTVRLWDAATLEPKAVLHGHANEVWCAAYSPDGKLLLTGGKDQNAMLWRPEPGRRREAIAYENETWPVFSPAGSELFCLQPGGNAEGALWNTEKSSIIATFPGRGPRVAGYSREGREVAFLSGDETALEFWAPGAAAPDRTVALSAPDRPGDATLNSSHSPSALAASSPALEEGAGERRRVALKPIESMPPERGGGYLKWGMSPEMGFFFAVDQRGVARIWSTDTGALARSFRGPAPPIRNTILAGNGRWFALSVERENTAHLYDCGTGAELILAGHKDFVSGLAFSPAGSLLATGSMDGTIRLWDAASGAPRGMLPGHMQETTDVAFSPDGRTLASLSQGESLKLWHVPTLREVYSEDMPRAGDWLRFSADGRRLAVGARGSQMLLLDAPGE